MNDTPDNTPKFKKIYSMKLISGEHILTDIVDNFSSRFTLRNPIIVELVNSSKGEFTYSRKYDPYSDATLIVLPDSSVASFPTIANDFYTRFYVHALMRYEIHRIMHVIGELNLTTDDEIAEMTIESNTLIEAFGDELTRMYGVTFDKKIDHKGFLFEQHPTIQ